MAGVSVSIGKLDALTNKHFIKRLEDNVFLANILWFYFKKRIKEAGGRDIRVPIRFGKNTTAGRWGGGGDVLDTTGQNNETSAVFPWRYYKSAIVLNNTDLAQNTGAEQIVDLLEEEVDNAQMSLMDNLDIDSFLDGEVVTGNQNKGLQGLTAAINYNSDGNISGGYGGISRASSTGGKNNPTGNAFWNAGVVMAANANTTTTFWKNPVTMDNSTILTLAKMFELAGAVGQPDLFICGQQLYNKFLSLLTTIQREASSEEIGRAGFTSAQFNFRPVVVADNIDNTGKMYALTMKDWDLYVLRGYNFKATPMKVPVNQDSVVKHVLFGGNPVCRRPQHQGVLTGLTAS